MKIPLALVVLTIFLQAAYAEVWIPENEFVGFFDSDGVYTVAGAVKNTQNYPVIPTITISIQDDQKVISKEFPYANIMPGKDMPFKFKFPEIQSSEPQLNKPSLSFIKGIHNPVDVQVIYDKTLQVHQNGHVTGRVINVGNETISNVQLFALAHGFDHKVLDVGKNIMPIDNLKPGELRNFTMYPDPSFISMVQYYSCFAPNDGSVIPVSSIRNGEKFFFRYDSGSWYAYAEFNDAGTELTMRTQNSYPISTYTNFEFPVFSNDEKFNVTLNDQKIDFIQSIDEMGNWHVAFEVKPHDAGTLKITGFAKDYEPIQSEIPSWIKDNAEWWSSDKIADDDFTMGLEFLIKEKILIVPPMEKDTESETKIPSWIKNNAGWWSKGLINDEDFINSLQYLISKGIISI